MKTDPKITKRILMSMIKAIDCEFRNFKKNNYLHEEEVFFLQKIHAFEYSDYISLTLIYFSPFLLCRFFGVINELTIWVTFWNHSL